MIVVLGASGYVGSTFLATLASQGITSVGLSRSEVDYTDIPVFTNYLREMKPEFVINAAGYTGRPNVDACEDHKSECLFGNAILPGRVVEACNKAGISWGHVSSGCIFTGSRPDGSGFTEEDVPNFTFRQNNCSWYSGTKALGEEILSDYQNGYIWRLRIPFSNVNEPRNYISKLLNYPRILDAVNSVSHLGDFVEAAIECWVKRVPYGTYNMTNPGEVSARQITDWLREYKLVEKDFDFFADEAEFMRLAARAPRSNCILNSDKLASVGIRMTPVAERVIDCLKTWHPTDTSTHVLV